nr:S-layer homology domain-containing protein [Acidimicrobiia bacterium]
ILSVVEGIGGFSDTVGNVHEDNIITISVLGITLVEDSYRPDENVTRGQMAAFLRRALNLPAATQDFFTDDDDSIFEDDINSIAQYGITVGSGGEYRPNENVTRGQMAAFLKRAFQIGAGGPTPFTDIDSSIFKGDIESIYAVGITVGTTPTTYSPNDPVTRGQMATFIARALGFA